MNEVSLHAEIADAAAAHLGWVPEVVTRLHAVESEVFELRREGQRALLKARDWAAGIALEAWAYEAARANGVKTAEVLAIDVSRSVYPFPFYISEYLEGTSLQLLEDSSADLSPIHQAVGAELRKLHELELPGWGWINRDRFTESGEVSGVHGDWESEMRALMSWAVPYIEEHMLIEASSIAQVEEHFRLLIPDAQPPTGVLLHGDMSPWHVLVNPSAKDVTGLIDFGDACVGDPLWDVACYSEHSIVQRDWLMQGYGLRPPKEQLTLLGFYRLIRSLGVIRWNHEHGFNIDEHLAVVDEELRRLSTG